jgi:hypothetical protein
MPHNLITIIKTIKEKFTDDSNLLWTGYVTAKELRDELDSYVNQFARGDNSCLDNLKTHFLPTSTFQEHSLQNGWSDEYIKLADEFDNIYKKMKNHS